MLQLQQEEFLFPNHEHYPPTHSPPIPPGITNLCSIPPWGGGSGTISSLGAISETLRDNHHVSKYIWCFFENNYKDVQAVERASVILRKMLDSNSQK